MEAVPTQLFQQLLTSLVLVVVTLLVYFVKLGLNSLIKYLDAKIGGEKSAQLQTFVGSVVRFLEQTGAFKALDSGEKKAMAIVKITQYCEEHGLPVDEAYINVLIEEAVQIMNAELGKAP
ncbi:MAG: phage holin family protein [Deltaproteobacteria bacterium]|nr:phage holin family protein [Deltaproteobacteria bacterium]